MKYRKWGRTARFENGTIVRVEEAGEAVEEGGEFHARPLDERKALPDLPVPSCPLQAERAVMVEGIAAHEVTGVAWTERTRRLHLSIARPPFRMLIDQADFEIDRGLLELFARLEGRREPPPRLTLAPRVTAAMLPALIGRIDLAQRAGETPDGNGQPVESRPVEGELPNWYRPSYRVRPVRAWFNLLALPFGLLDHGVPRAVALLDHGDVLCADGDHVYAAALSIARVLAVGGAVGWYPYSAGVWGAEILVECGRPGRADQASRPIALPPDETSGGCGREARTPR